LKTKVVHCKRKKFDVYIGRPSKWGNPFLIGRDGSRQEVIGKYEKHILLRPDLLNDLHDLKGKTLGCWCKPKLCHGDVLAKLANSLGVDKLREWYGKGCKHQNCMFEKDLDGVEDRSSPVLVFCNHPLNTDDCEGNCRLKLCPIKDQYMDALSCNIPCSMCGFEDKCKSLTSAIHELRRDNEKLSGSDVLVDVKKIAQVTFAGNNEVKYDFFTDLDLKIDDPVVCHTVRGYGVAKVAGFVETSTKAKDWIVQKVDVDRYKALVERDRQARELEDLLR